MNRVMFKGLALALLLASAQALAEDAKPATPAPAAPGHVTPAPEATPEADTADQGPAVDPNLPPRLPLNELRVFAEAFDRISSAYVQKIDDRTLLDNAIKGMLSELDPHSAYLDKKSFADLQENTTGNYGGLGLEVGMEAGFVRVISPMDDTPAAKAGIKPGDVIVKINDKPIKGVDLQDAIDAMRGEPGSQVKLTILREGEDTPRDFNLTREIIQVASVRSKLIEDGYGYIRIAQFQSGTGKEVRDALKKLTAEGQLQGLILDLRNDPGGVLQAAVEVADAFIDKGLIVYTTGRLPNADLRFSATTPDMTGGVPLVVLVNEGTASASEIVAGALQDHKRGVIMGVRTFGKGSVQTILPLDNDKAIKLTTALYFTPNGRSIQAEGIVPDIWVDNSKITPEKANPFWLKEKDLPGHLANVYGRTKEQTQREIDQQAEADKLASTDYQLNEALTLLKGLNIITPKTRQG